MYSGLQNEIKGDRTAVFATLGVAPRLMCRWSLLVLRWKHNENVAWWLGFGITWGVDNAMEKHLVRPAPMDGYRSPDRFGSRADGCPLDQSCRLNQVWPVTATLT